MSRFAKIGIRNVNIDKIRCYWNEGEAYDDIVVQLDDGKTIRAHDERSIAEGDIIGRNHITQIIPCIKTLYARYEIDGNEVEYPVYYLGLCADGFVRPLDVCGYDGVGFADESRNYIGLYSETLDR